MRFVAFEGKGMFNKRLMRRAPMQRSDGCLDAGKKKSRNRGSQELTGRRQTKWLQPLGENPDHWINTVNTRKA